ncbi:hypothetical protein SUSAZ_10890 [Sulfolobus acidocaldarius SUSAZ]|nr:hypothetical protein SUSAZ_10890 [Sulfolobus acidocaldarius SUSAZ]
MSVVKIAKMYDVAAIFLEDLNNLVKHVKQLLK